MFCIVFVYDWIKNGSSIWEAGGGDSLRQGGGGKERGEILHDRASEWVQKLEWEKESDRERKRDYRENLERKKLKEKKISQAENKLWNSLLKMRF